jgi:1-acyl-sn-glycerol-3-phosphate acyltransferase
LIRTLLMLGFWAIALPPTALFCFPYTLITGDAGLLYRVAIWCAAAGVKLAGVRTESVGLEKIPVGQRYIFMANHVSTLDPPLLLPLIPGRTAVMAKKELFDYPILGKAMLLGSFVPVDRGNRDAGIAAVREAKKVIEQGISMTIFPEGKRSFDGKLLPFKRGPFYLAMECGIPIVPLTIVGTQEAMPKGRFAIKPGMVTVTFHDPIDSAQFTDRDALILAVRRSINAGLPPEYQEASGAASEAVAEP